MHDGARAATEPKPAGEGGREVGAAAVLFRRSDVVELVVLAGLGFAALIVIGVLLSVFSVVGWFLWLPFKILGWALRLVGMVIALPFVIIACLLGGFGMFLGMGVLVFPLLPLLAIGAGIWFLLFRPRGNGASQARVV